MDGIARGSICGRDSAGFYMWTGQRGVLYVDGIARGSICGRDSVGFYMWTG